MKNTLYCLVLVLFAAASCEKDKGSGGSSGGPADVIYIETNNYTDNQNAVIAYRTKADGTVEQLPGSPFLTGGAGVGDPLQLLGPLDSDTQLKLTADKKFLLAVNSGSNTIAVFNVHSDGTLAPVAGSPFPSGGQTPVSIDIKDNNVFVVNKSNDYVHPITLPPNYTIFTIDANGSLAAVPSSTVETTPGASPAQALVSNDGKFLFGADFLGFQLLPPQGTLRSFTITTGETISLTGATQQSIPETGGALGLWQNPKDNTLYVGFPLAAKLGVYSINSTSGALTFQTSVAAGPAACWIRTAQNGDRLYVLNSGENSISVYNSSNSTAPVSMAKLALKQAGPTYLAMGLPFVSSECFAFEFSPTEKYLYVVSQHTNPDFSIGNYNYFHVLTVADDGTLSEPGEPLQLPVENVYRPQGTAVYRTN